MIKSNCYFTTTYTYDIRLTTTTVTYLQVAMSLSNKDICDTAFHFNCGNSRCIRQVLLCDGRDNCGNYEDEAFCGLDTLSASLLFSTLTISLVFMLSVFWFDSHPQHVLIFRNLNNIMSFGRSKSVQLN